MDLNPLSDIESKMNRQKLDKSISDLHEDVKFIKGKINMTKYIEVNTLSKEPDGSVKFIKTSINPDYIVSIREEGNFTSIHMTNDYLIIKESREEVLNLISGIKSYIG